MMEKIIRKFCLDVSAFSVYMNIYRNVKIHDNLFNNNKIKICDFKGIQLF